MARRCLYFDSSDSDSSSSDESDTSDYGQLVPYKPGNGLQMCTLPGISLHLNSLMTTSKDGRMVLQDNPGFRIKVTKIPDFVGSPEVAQELHIQRDSWSVGGDAEVMEDASCSPANGTHEELNQSSQGLMIESWKATNDLSICMLPSMGLHLNALVTASMDSPGSGMQLTIMRSSVVSRQVAQESEIRRDSRSVGVDAEVMQDGSCTRTAGTGERLDHFRKRHKSDAGENETYGFHNCKKSKCLKLYCECFTASASCQDCLDEDIVLATCKQEDAQQNPASARQRNGCNCKKSRCPHKCCDSYQGGVGC